MDSTDSVVSNSMMEVVEWLENNSSNIDLRNMMSVLPSMLQLQNSKSKSYGRSWCRHGDLSAYFNLERKWDRLYNLMDRAMSEGSIQELFNGDADTSTETFVDTIVDLSLYSLMWVGYIFEHHPDAYRRFLEMNDLDAPGDKGSE